VGPRAGMDTEAAGKILFPLREKIRRLQIPYYYQVIQDVQKVTQPMEKCNINFISFIIMPISYNKC
jgi:hypothetical protein